MKETLEKIYWCEHCNRAMRNKGAMSRHEMFCKENPNNKHKCFDFCKHLERSYSLADTGDYDNQQRITHMTCAITNEKMYSFKFEKNTNKPIGILNNLIRMPLECKHHEHMYYNQQEDIYDIL